MIALLRELPHRILRWALSLGATLIILFAVLTLALRLTLPHADGLRNLVAAQLGDYLGVELTVGRLGLHLAGFQPELTLRDAVLSDPDGGERLLALDALRVDLDLRASLFARAARVDGVTLVGAHIELYREADGRIGVRGLDRIDGGEGGGALTFFLREGRFSLAHSRVDWTDHQGDGATLAFSVRRLDLDNQGERHRMRLRASPTGAEDPVGAPDEGPNQVPSASPARTLADDPAKALADALAAALGEGTAASDEEALLLLADLTGPPGHPERWSGPLYASWRGAGIGDLLSARLPPGLEVGVDDLDLRAWLRLDQGRPERLLTLLRADALALRRAGPADDASVLAPLDLRLSARWRRDATGWRLDAPDIELGRGPDAATTSLAAAEFVADGRRTIVLRFGGLDLDWLAALADVLAPEALPDALHALLQGRIIGRLGVVLGQFSVRAPGSAGEEEAGSAGWLADATWRVNGGIEGLGIGPEPSADATIPEGPIPPLDGLDLRFSAAPGLGILALASRDLVLDLRPNLLEPTRLTDLDAELHWRLPESGGWLLEGENLRADTADVETESRLLLRPANGAKGVYLDLASSLRGGDARAVPRYLPVSKMDDQLEDWLTRAIVAGRLDTGELRLRGDLARFPFDGDAGEFKLTLNVRDGVLDYQPGKPAGAAPADGAPRGKWPPLEDIDAELRFEGRRFRIDVASARILNTRVDSGSASMPNLWKPRIMAIEARGQGPLSDGLDFLADTPLSAKLGGVPRALAVEGEGALALTLDVPLSKGLEFGYSGQLNFVDSAAVTLRADDLRLTDVDGRLGFDNRGVNAEAITASLGEQPLRLSLKSSAKADGSGGVTDLEIRGRTPIERLAEALPNPWWGIADGRIDWRLSTSLDDADAAIPDPPLTMRLSSDLVGLALDLPAPFGKARNAKRELAFRARLVPNAPIEVTGRVGDIGIAADLRRAPGGPRPQRIALDLNQPARLPSAPGIAVGGSLQTLDLGDWLTWQARRSDLFRKTEDGAGGPPLLPVELSADEVRLGALRFGAVKATISPDAGGWRVGASANGDGIAVDLPADIDRGIKVRLDTLDVAPLIDDGNDKGAVSASRGAGPDPRRFPPLSLSVEALRNGPDRLGRLRLDLARTDSGLRMTDLSLNGEQASIEGTGSWMREDDGFVETGIDLRLRSDALGEFLRRAGYFSSLSGAPGDGELDLTWPGGPQAFDLARVRGSLRANIGEGRLLDVEPGVGRVLSVLNLAAIGRRMDLDFSDVTGEGFSFDAIDGRVTIGNGIARIGSLQIRSSTADIRVRGSANLADQTLDQSLRVTPKIGTGVAIAGAVAGGPLVGAAVLLADKISGDTVDRLAAYEYSVTGPWAKPKIRRVGGQSSVPDLLASPPRGSAQDAGAGPGVQDRGSRSVPDRSGARTGSAPPPRPANPFLDVD